MRLRALSLIFLVVWVLLTQVVFSLAFAEIIHPGSVGGSAIFKGVAWVPTKLGSKLYLWYSPDELTNTVSGGLVSTIVDKSGNNHPTTQSDNTKQAALTSNCINGKNCFTFNGTSDFYSLTSALDVAKNRQNLGVYFYLKPNNDQVSQYLFLATIASSTSARVLYSLDASTKFSVGGRRLDADSAAITSNMVYYKVSDMLFHGDMDFANNTMYSQKNGFTFYKKTSSWASGGGSSQNANSLYVALGATGTGTASWYNGSVGDIVVTTSTLTSDDKDRILKFYSKKYNKPMLTTSTKTVVMMAGDSITASNNLSYGQSISKAVQDLLNDPSLVVVNLGISGRTLSQMTTDAATFTDTVAASIPSTGVKRILVVWAGTNDLAGGASVATTYGRLKTYIAARKATGYYDKIVVVDPLSRTGQTTNMSNYRDQINSNKTDLGYDTVCDPWTVQDAGVYPYGTNANFSSATYWQSLDGIHPTYYGVGLLAPCITTAIQGALL